MVGVVGMVRSMARQAPGRQMSLAEVSIGAKVAQHHFLHHQLM